MTKLNHADRRSAILDAAMLAAGNKGYALITREDVAERAGVSPGLVQYHFNTMHELKRSVISEAIRTENLAILAQAVGASNEDVMEVEPELFERVLGHIRKQREGVTWGA